MCFWCWWFHWGEGGSHTPCHPRPLCVLHCCPPMNQNRVNTITISFWWHQKTTTEDWARHARPILHLRDSDKPPSFPIRPAFPAPILTDLAWCWCADPWLRPGLLTYQATLRMWPRSSPVGGALKPPEHRVLGLSVGKVQVQHTNCWQLSWCWSDLWFLTTGGLCFM